MTSERKKKVAVTSAISRIYGKILKTRKEREYAEMDTFIIYGWSGYCSSGHRWLGIHDPKTHRRTTSTWRTMDEAISEKNTEGKGVISMLNYMLRD